jgi:type II secretory pathway component PulF
MSKEDDSISDFIVDKNASMKRNPFVNIQCVNKSSPAAAAAPSTIFGELTDFLRKIIFAVVIVIMVIVIVGCLVLALKGAQAFDEYWAYNLGIVTKLIAVSKSTTDKIGS